MVSFDTQQQATRRVRCSSPYERTRELVAQLDEIILDSKIGYIEGMDILEARDIAFHAHFRQQDRPDGQPFINHPLEVTITAAKKFCLADPVALKAALLHAVVEYQADRVPRLLGAEFSSSQNIREQAVRLLGVRFGARVAEMVAILTPPDFREMALKAQMRGDARDLIEIERHLTQEHFVLTLKSDPEAFLIKVSELTVSACSFAALPEGGARVQMRERFGPFLLDIVERLKDVPNKGHRLSGWRDSLRSELMWLHARNYPVLEA